MPRKPKKKKEVKLPKVPYVPGPPTIYPVNNDWMPKLTINFGRAEEEAFRIEQLRDRYSILSIREIAQIERVGIGYLPLTNSIDVREVDGTWTIFFNENIESEEEERDCFFRGLFVVSHMEKSHFDIT